MAIKWSDIIGDKTLGNGGYMGDLMTVARAHIGVEIKAGRLTQNQAGQVYATMVQSAIQTGVKFAIDQESLRLGLIPSTLAKG